MRLKQNDNLVKKNLVKKKKKKKKKEGSYHKNWWNWK